MVVNDLDSAEEPTLTREANDHLAEAVKRHPDRFARFALLPMRRPDQAAIEFERAVGKLGFKGAMISGTIDGKFLDDRRFEPVFYGFYLILALVLLIRDLKCQVSDERMEREN